MLEYFESLIFFFFQEYNEPPPAKRPSVSRGHEQAPAASTYTTTQNHIEEQTDYPHHNEM